MRSINTKVEILWHPVISIDCMNLIVKNLHIILYFFRWLKGIVHLYLLLQIIRNVSRRIVKIKFEIINYCLLGEINHCILSYLAKDLCLLTMVNFKCFTEIILWLILLLTGFMELPNFGQSKYFLKEIHDMNKMVPILQHLFYFFSVN